MITYSRDPHQTVPTSSVKIVGLGGAGANMLERIALDGMEGAELIALNTDVRTLGACLASLIWFPALGYGARALAGPLGRPGVWRLIDLVIGMVMIAIAIRLITL